MNAVKNLRSTNGLIFALSIIGSLIITFVGVTRGECIDYCDASYAEYVPDPGLIGFGIAGLLISSLLYQVINVFAWHVEMSHKD
jgi:hypothetical protein